LRLKHPNASLTALHGRFCTSLKSGNIEPEIRVRLLFCKGEKSFCQTQYVGNSHQCPCEAMESPSAWEGRQVTVRTPRDTSTQRSSKSLDRQGGRFWLSEMINEAGQNSTRKSPGSFLGSSCLVQRKPGQESHQKAATCFREDDTGFGPLRRGIRLYGTTVAP
jgi:hypothetical protein